MSFGYQTISGFKFRLLERFSIGSVMIAAIFKTSKDKISTNIQHTLCINRMNVYLNIKINECVYIASCNNLNIVAHNMKTFLTLTYFSPAQKLFSLSQESGRNAAKYFISTYPKYFQKDYAQPHIPVSVQYLFVIV